MNPRSSPRLRHQPSETTQDLGRSPAPQRLLISSSRYLLGYNNLPGTSRWVVFPRLLDARSKFGVYKTGLPGFRPPCSSYAVPQTKLTLCDRTVGSAKPRLNRFPIYFIACPLPMALGAPREQSRTAQNLLRSSWPLVPPRSPPNTGLVDTVFLD